MSVHVWTCTCERRCSYRPVVLNPPEVGTTGSCELPDSDDGNLTQVLCKSSKCSYLLRGEKSPPFLFLIVFAFTISPKEITTCGRN